jgi:hypothetical protein
MEELDAKMIVRSCKWQKIEEAHFGDYKIKISESKDFYMEILGFLLNLEIKYWKIEDKKLKITI